MISCTGLVGLGLRGPSVSKLREAPSWQEVAQSHSDGGPDPPRNKILSTPKTAVHAEAWKTQAGGRKSENSKLYFGHGKGLNKYLLRESKEPHAE